MTVGPFFEIGASTTSAYKAVAITPHDANDEAFAMRGIYVGGAGNVVVVNLDATTATFSNVPAGTILPVKARRVNATLTTATNLVALL